MAGTGLLAALCLIRFEVITIRLPRDGNSIAYLSLARPGDLFSLDYRHSVEKTRVKGIFRVSETGTMEVVETRMTSVGTGLPNTFPKRTRQDGQWLVVDEANQPLDAFRFFIQPVNQTVLTTPRGRFDLMTLPPGTIILVGVETMPLYRLLLIPGTP